MAILLAVAADHRSGVDVLTNLKRGTWRIPIGMASALVIFCTAYWGLHLAFYGIDGKLDGHDGPKSTTPVIPSIRMPTVERERSADSHISE